MNLIIKVRYCKLASRNSFLSQPDLLKFNIEENQGMSQYIAAARI